jgi:hypothetical protein
MPDPAVHPAQPPGAAPPPLAFPAGTRAAGLIYTQHIIALHAPIRDGRLRRPASPPAPHGERGGMTGLHLPAHSDLLLFATPEVPRP